MSARADAASATAERLLEAAWRHFATRPYEQVRLREIAHSPARATLLVRGRKVGRAED